MSNCYSHTNQQADYKHTDKDVYEFNSVQPFYIVNT